MLARRRRKECSRFSTQLCNSTAQDGHVVQDKCAWPNTCMMGQRLGLYLPERFGGEGGTTPLDGAVACAGDANPGKSLDEIQLWAGMDDPGTHQNTKHRIIAACCCKA